MKIDSKKTFNYNGIQIRYIRKINIDSKFEYDFLDMSKDILDDGAIITLTEKEVKTLC